jgi:Domain of unknown function (DUF4382)
MQGIQLRSRASAGDGADNWEELLPRLAVRPQQIDLMSAAENGITAQLVGQVSTIPAGNYDRVRVLFTLKGEVTPNMPLAENACGLSGTNCVFKADDTVQPLTFLRDSLELTVSVDAEADGFFFMPPEGNGELLIELTPIWTIAASPGGSLQLIPTLTGSARFHRKSSTEEP